MVVNVESIDEAIQFIAQGLHIKCILSIRIEYDDNGKKDKTEIVHVYVHYKIMKILFNNFNTDAKSIKKYLNYLIWC